MAKSSGKFLTYDNRVRNLLITIYYEQLFNKAQRNYYLGLFEDLKTEHATSEMQETIDAMRNIALQNLDYRIKNLDDKFFITGIQHNKDVKKSDNNLEIITKKKPHFHIAVWRLNDEAFKIRQITEALGIIFDPEKDYGLWQKGVDTFRKNNRPSILMYETHETVDAILQGKYQYDIKDIMTNQPIEKIEKIREKYQRTTKHAKMTDAEWDQASEDAYKLGYDLKDFDKWGDACFTTKQRTSSPFKDVRTHYERGLTDRINENSYTMRDSILIWGAQNAGKSYTMLETLKEMGEKIYKTSSKTGKYDGLKANTTAMIFNDINVSDPLSVFDNQILTLYRRNSGLAPWTGHIAGVTTNLDPWNWIGGEMHLPSYDETRFDKDMHYRDKSQEFSYQALKSRLYICHIEQGHLVCDSVEDRGTDKDKEEHDKLYIKFADTFNKILMKYHHAVRTLNAGLYVGDEQELVANEMYNRFAKIVGEKKASGYISEELREALSSGKYTDNSNKTFEKIFGLEIL